MARSDTDPLPNPAEKNKHWKQVGKNKWREISGDEAISRRLKGFNIKRDKGGKGFSMMIHKKIKGFEEGTDMTKNIDEAEGIKTVSTKGYSGSKPMKPKYRGLTKGFINWKGGQPAGDADKDVLAWHKAEAAKAGKVVQLRYRGPRGKGMSGLTRRMGVGPQQSHTTKGAGTGAAIYYKDKWQLGGRQRAKHYGWNEEIEMEDGEYEVIYENENETENEGDEQVVQEPNVSDLVMHTIEQKPLEFQQTFADLMQQRIEDAVAEKKLEIASVFTNPSQYEPGDEEEPAEEEPEVEEGEVEEEPEVQAEE